MCIRDRGLSACTYSLVARMDSDDLSLPNRFETQLKVFEKDLEVLSLIHI